ncbi:Hint domain-containing protein [uncultured Tateyamaria sp.]|uniref:Hint domain-containing protein n=1 Tax=uncultured Tateyamaria sp. TaxID=455651 RepID=UPI002616508F|nr:Hint domain-containing protein [uncultured Tateyamaria sp.]
MTDRLVNELAINVDEIDTPFYFEGGTFSLGGGPFTEQSFSAQDDDVEFSSLSTQSSEANDAGRQTGQLRDGDGNVTADGVASLQEVIYLTDPDSGATVRVARIRLSEDDNSFGSGAELGDVLVFDGPIDPNITYTVTSIDYQPGDGPDHRYEYSEFSGGSVESSGAVCFAAGTRILTAHGECPVELLGPGSLVQTVDGGLKRVLWAGSTRITRAELRHDVTLRPVRIEAGALGNTAPLLVSQQHRIEIRGELVKAKHLPFIPGLRARFANGIKEVRYHHILLEDHHMLIANGIEAESLFLGPETLRVLHRRRLMPARFAEFDRQEIRHEICRPLAKRHRLPQLFGHPAERIAV